MVRSSKASLRTCSFQRQTRCSLLRMAAIGAAVFPLLALASWSHLNALNFIQLHQMRREGARSTDRDCSRHLQDAHFSLLRGSRTSRMCLRSSSEDQEEYSEESAADTVHGFAVPWRSIGAFLATLLLGASTATAELRPEVPRCLLQNCQGALAKCLLSPTCAADLTCILACTSSPDEGGCQVKCGDFFENEVVQEFNSCALKPQNRGCVPQRQDNGEYPVPPPESISQDFEVELFNGPWYISAGLNPIFDTFPCQVHFFIGDPPSILDGSPGRLYAKLNWRVLEPDGEFFTRSTVQRFVQDDNVAGILYNRNNEYLHYEDDWYILDHGFESDKEKGFVLVYYRGRNDAWLGYGGAVLYTRTRTVPEELKPRIREACRLAGIDYGKFIETDNSCEQLTADPNDLRRQYLEDQAKRAILNVEEQLTLARRYATEAIISTEQEAEREIKEIPSGFFKKLQSGWKKDVETPEDVKEDLFFSTAAAFEQRLERMAKGFGDEVAKDATLFEQFVEKLFSFFSKP